MMLRAASLVSAPRFMRAALLGFVVCACLASLAQQMAVDSTDNATVSQQSAEPITADHEYVISADDLLDVYIVDVPELSRAYRVSPTGALSLPLLGNPVPVSGLTLADCADRIGSELRTAGLVSTPQVTVSVQQSRFHSVTIMGAVKRPQIYPVIAATTLLGVLSQAEGLADDASSIALVRRGTIGMHVLGLDSPQVKPEDREKQATFKVDIKHVMESTDPDANVVIYPGDSVTVARAGIVYVVGAVHRPGGFTMKPSKHGMSVLQAVALAEDLKPTAVGSKSVLLRVDPQAADGRKQIPIDLKKVLSGQAKDVALQADDVLFIPDSPAKKALRRGLESALQVATGLAIYRY